MQFRLPVVNPGCCADTACPSRVVPAASPQPEPRGTSGGHQRPGCQLTALVLAELSLAPLLGRHEARNKAGRIGGRAVPRPGPARTHRLRYEPRSGTRRAARRAGPQGRQRADGGDADLRPAQGAPTPSRAGSMRPPSPTTPGSHSTPTMPTRTTTANVHLLRSDRAAAIADYLGGELRPASA